MESQQSKKIAYSTYKPCFVVATVGSCRHTCCSRPWCDCSMAALEEVDGWLVVETVEWSAVVMDNGCTQCTGQQRPLRRHSAAPALALPLRNPHLPSLLCFLCVWSVFGEGASRQGVVLSPGVLGQPPILSYSSQCQPCMIARTDPSATSNDRNVVISHWHATPLLPRPDLISLPTGADSLQPFKPTFLLIQAAGGDPS